tara:strand:- start:773 stop:1639 length:867 start_codon:yes stop_codon:yes gene_type:complete
MSIKFNVKDIPFFSEKKILKYEILSKSFGMICERIDTDSNYSFVIKRLINKNNNYNALISEGKSLIFMKNLFPKLFPKIYFKNDKLLIMDYVKHDKYKGDNFEKELATKIASIHKIKNNKFGFDYDTPIGALKQPSGYDDNWVNFYREKRLGMVFNHINNSNPMPKEINFKLEKILNKLEDFIPQKPKPSLIHGDLWEGNILFDRGKLKCLIDPGIHFAHNELEISYLTWFKYVKKDFFIHYSKFIEIDKYFHNYEPIYQLYYCLLNVHLWSRDYIKNTKDLVDKIYK